MTYAINTATTIPAPADTDVDLFVPALHDAATLYDAREPRCVACRDAGVIWPQADLGPSVPCPEACEAAADREDFAASEYRPESDYVCVTCERGFSDSPLLAMPALCEGCRS
jgi:hypothetical protein